MVIIFFRLVTIFTWGIGLIRSTSNIEDRKKTDN